MEDWTLAQYLSTDESATPEVRLFAAVIARAESDAAGRLVEVPRSKRGEVQREAAAWLAWLREETKKTLT